jgi:hypothetical protein
MEKQRDRRLKSTDKLVPFLLDSNPLQNWIRFLQTPFILRGVPRVTLLNSKVLLVTQHQAIILIYKMSHL